MVDCGAVLPIVSNVDPASTITIQHNTVQTGTGFVLDGVRNHVSNDEPQHAFPTHHCSTGWILPVPCRNLGPFRRGLGASVCLPLWCLSALFGIHAPSLCGRRTNASVAGLGTLYPIRDPAILHLLVGRDAVLLWNLRVACGV